MYSHMDMGMHHYIYVGIKITLFFLYKNKVYKNVEPQICQILKNILDAEIVIILQLFLSPYMEAQNTFSVGKVIFFVCFGEIFGQKLKKL